MSYKCPNCGTVLLYDYETEDEIIFYCMTCHKNIKAKKNKTPKINLREDKRFIIDYNYKEYCKLIDKETDAFYYIDDSIANVELLCEKLNKLYNENIDMKFFINNLSSQRDEFFNGARENAKRVGELLRENENQKKKLSDIKGQLVMLDNCDNWNNDRKMSFIREIADIMNYHGGF